MPYRITYVLDIGPSSSGLRGYGLSCINILAEALARIDVLFLKAHPEVPPLYSSGVKHMVEPPGQEDWQDVPTSLKLGIVDGEDAAAWRAAELHVRQNIVAKPVFDGRRFLVRYPDGQLEDPLQHLPTPPQVRIGGDHPRSFRRSTFALDLFNGPKDRALSHATLNIMLDALTAICVTYLREHPEAPGLYRSGVRYMEEPPGQEDWQDIPTSIKMKTADCEDHACWRAAELIVRQNIPAKAFFKESRRKDGGYLFHILVRYPDGRVEDPSRILGMR